MSALFMVFMGMVVLAGLASCSKANAQTAGAAKQAETSGAVTLYNSDLEKIESSWTYIPTGAIWSPLILTGGWELKGR